MRRAHDNDILIINNVFVLVESYNSLVAQQAALLNCRDGALPPRVPIPAIDGLDAEGLGPVLRAIRLRAVDVIFHTHTRSCEHHGNDTWCLRTHSALTCCAKTTIHGPSAAMRAAADYLAIIGRVKRVLASVEAVWAARDAIDVGGECVSIMRGDGHALDNHAIERMTISSLYTVLVLLATATGELHPTLRRSLNLVRREVLDNLTPIAPPATNGCMTVSGFVELAEQTALLERNRALEAQVIALQARVKTLDRHLFDITKGCWDVRT